MAYATSELHTIHSSSLIATLHFSQQAPIILNRQLSLEKNPILSLVSNQEGPEKYGTIEQLFFSCLQSGDDRSALECLDQLTLRFGASNERIMGLRGLYEEAVAENQSDLEECLRKYDVSLSENPVNLPILKRRITLLRSLGRSAEAIASLVDFLKAIPTDAEAWCELAELYQSQGMGAQAIFSLEEALLVAPNAWNIHARLGELLYVCACSSDLETSCQHLRKSIQHFCRSIELCDDFLRGYYGLAMATSPLPGNKGDTQASPLTLVESSLSKDTLERLNSFAKRGLQGIVKRRSLKHHLWEYSQGELIAAKELIGRM